MTPPSISKEARDWLSARISRMIDLSMSETAYQNGIRHTAQAFETMLIEMPLTPPDPLDEIRARFAPLTRGGYPYEIFAERDGQLWGRIKDGQYWFGNAWHKDGASILCGGNDYNLLPANPRADLIKELREIYEKSSNEQMMFSNHFELMRRAADALEKVKP